MDEWQTGLITGFGLLLLIVIIESQKKELKK